MRRGVGGLNRCLPTSTTKIKILQPHTRSSKLNKAVKISKTTILVMK